MPMDTKKAKYIDAVFNYFSTDLTRDNNAVQTLLDELCSIEVNEAFAMWEYLLIRQEKKLAEEKTMETLITRPLAQLTEKSNRTPKIVLETPMLLKALYFYNPAPAEGISLDIAIYGLMSGKVSQAEEIFKYLLKNTASKKTYGENMRIIVETLFMELLKKKGGTSKKVDLNKKLQTTLVQYVKKISGPERALLEQRIREVV